MLIIIIMIVYGFFLFRINKQLTAINAFISEYTNISDDDLDIAIPWEDEVSHE